MAGREVARKARTLAGRRAAVAPAHKAV
jgi:hypothetical protein